MISSGSAVEKLCNNIPLPRDQLQGSPIAHNVTVRRNRNRAFEEIVSDSEEDRMKSCRNEAVIVISSDSEAQEEEEVKVILNLEPTVESTLPVHCSSSGSGSESLSKMPVRGKLKMQKAGRRFPVSRKIIESSESEDSGPESMTTRRLTKEHLTGEVIELSSSSEDGENHASSQRPLASHVKASQESLPSYLTQEDDGAILIFDEPKGAKKPVRVAVPLKYPPSEQLRDVVTTLNADRPTSSLLLESPALVNNPDPDADVSTPVGRKTARPKSAKMTMRVSKKAIEGVEQARRENYAQELFDELNRSVFRNGLPEKTKLSWNKRLLTTAGKAKFRRSRDGVETSEIELATKILDCDERIRNTLSHEMCHLATWVVDKKLDENHGKLFKYWASKVTKRRPDIEITTRHSYEISYPYKWECQKCQKIYGRYSRSIRPDECVCGACREGRLVPLFTVRSRAQTPKVSRLAAGKSQDSPCSLPHMTRASTEQADFDVDPEMEALTAAVAETRLL